MSLMGVTFHGGTGATEFMHENCEDRSTSLLPWTQRGVEEDLKLRAQQFSESL